MTRRRFVLALIVTPAIVSFLITLLVLWIWDSRREPVTYIYPTDSPTSQVAAGAAPSAAESAEPPMAETPTPGAGVESPPPPSGSPEPVAQPSGGGCENPIHVVEAGNTLVSIAQQYGVAMDDIILANPDMPAPDFLSIGQTILIPVCGVPTPIATPTPTVTPLPPPIIPTPIPTPTTPPPGEIALEIREIRGVGDVTTEAVVIANLGSQVDLEGWTLTDEDGNQFTFPALQLFSGEVTIYTGVGQDTPIDLHWGLSEAVWAPGETAVLYNPIGALQASYQVP